MTNLFWTGYMVNEKLEVSRLGRIMDNRCFHFWCLFKSNLSKTENCSFFKLGKWPVSKWLVDSAWCLIKFAHKSKLSPCLAPWPSHFKSQSWICSCIFFQMRRSGPRCFTHLSFYLLICLFVVFCCPLVFLCNTCWKYRMEHSQKKSSFIEDERIYSPNRDQWFTVGQDQWFTPSTAPLEE